MKQIIDRTLYDTTTATEIASTYKHDGNGYYSHGNGSALYKTKKGNFFIHYMTLFLGENDYIKTVSIDDAIDYYESVNHHDIEFAEAFGFEPDEG